MMLARSGRRRWSAQGTGRTFMMKRKTVLGPSVITLLVSGFGYALCGLLPPVVCCPLPRRRGLRPGGHGPHRAGPGGHRPHAAAAPPASGTGMALSRARSGQEPAGRAAATRPKLTTDESITVFPFLKKTFPVSRARPAPRAAPRGYRLTHAARASPGTRAAAKTRPDELANGICQETNYTQDIRPCAPPARSSIALSTQW
jgi:hypothetical protein